MLGSLLDISIIIDGEPFTGCHFENLDLSKLKGKWDKSPPPLNRPCSVLVTREIHNSHVTLELIGSISKVDGNDFTITFSNISEDTLKQIDSIILCEEEKH